MDAVIEYAMQTPDGGWRVEVIKRGRTRWYRVIHGDNELDWLSIAAVQRIFTESRAMATCRAMRGSLATERRPGHVHVSRHV
jgi:bifunctional non-homologous end joining protein LigD